MRGKRAESKSLVLVLHRSAEHGCDHRHACNGRPDALGSHSHLVHAARNRIWQIDDAATATAEIADHLLDPLKRLLDVRISRNHRRTCCIPQIVERINDTFDGLYGACAISTISPRILARISAIR